MASQGGRRGEQIIKPILYLRGPCREHILFSRCQLVLNDDVFHTDCHPHEVLESNPSHMLCVQYSVCVVCGTLTPQDTHPNIPPRGGTPQGPCYTFLSQHMSPTTLKTSLHNFPAISRQYQSTSGRARPQLPSPAHVTMVRSPAGTIRKHHGFLQLDTAGPSRPHQELPQEDLGRFGG